MSDTMIVVASGWLFDRGDYVAIAGAKHRVLAVTQTTLTTRRCHKWRVIEWCHARLEDWVLWPLRAPRRTTEKDEP